VQENTKDGSGKNGKIIVYDCEKDGKIKTVK
jgi:hypothetical protein